MGAPEISRSDDPGGLSIGGRLRFLAKDSVIYGGAFALNKAFSLVTFPILTRHLSVGDYGLMDFFNVIANLLAIAVVFGQDSAVARFFYEYPEPAQRRQVVSQSLVLQLLFCCLLLPPLWLYSDSVAGQISSAPDAHQLLLLILLQVPVLMLGSFSQSILKWTFSRWQFLFVSLGPTVLTMGLLVAAVSLVDLDVTDIFIITTAVRIVFAIIGLWFCRQWLEVPRNVSHVRELVAFALPFGVICVMGALVPTLERTAVIQTVGERQLGIYSVGSTVAGLTMLATQAFQMTWGPFSLSIYRGADAAATFNWVAKLFSLVICTLVLLLALISEPTIGLLASAKYSAAAVIVFPLAMGFAIQAVGWITEIGIVISKRSHLNLYAYAAYLLTTAIGMLLLAGRFGIVGIALAVLLGHVSRSIAAYWLARKVYPLPWPALQLIVCIGVTLAVGFVGQVCRVALGEGWQAGVLCMGVALLWFAAWQWMFTANERATLSLLWRNKKLPAWR